MNLNLARAKCTACGTCVTACPHKARVQMFRLADSERIVEELTRHAVFYRYSGGITFSGGGCAAQPAFLDDLTRRIYDLGYSMAMETCGFFEFETVLRISAGWTK